MYTILQKQRFLDQIHVNAQLYTSDEESAYSYFHKTEF